METKNALFRKNIPIDGRTNERDQDFAILFSCNCKRWHSSTSIANGWHHPPSGHIWRGDKLRAGWPKSYINEYALVYEKEKCIQVELEGAAYRAEGYSGDCGRASEDQHDDQGEQDSPFFFFVSNSVAANIHNKYSVGPSTRQI